MEKTPLVSVILSFRNEEQVIPELIGRLQQVLKSLPVDYELIFVNDASTDNSLLLLKERTGEDKRIKLVNMSRRFGVSECVLAGMKYAKGDAIIYMDADLQDPPEVIPELIEKWQQGADVVHTVRTAREGESALKLALTDTAYSLIEFSSNIDLTPEAGDFKLLSRRVVSEVLLLKEASPYLRGLVSWVGFNQVNVPYRRQKRAAGETKFPLLRNILRDMADLRGPAGAMIIGLTSFSLLPMMVLLLTGLVMCVGAFVATLVSIVLAFARTDVPALAGILIIVFLLSGMQLFGMGVLGIYLGRIYQDVRGRPRYIVESAIGFEGEQE
jgi:polyisoprenyl-phosphate glycosyltransferase